MFFFQAEDGIRDIGVTGVQTCALPICTTGDATHLVKVNVPDMATLEKIVDDLTETGARCQTTIVLSSPVPYRPVTPPEGLTVQRPRLTRRRRRAAAEDGSPAEMAKRPGRPRGRRSAAV